METGAKKKKKKVIWGGFPGRVNFLREGHGARNIRNAVSLF